METDDIRAKAPETPAYDDARRKKEILPPRETWPAAMRPAIRGRVKVLEDRPLIGHRVKMVGDVSKEGTVPSADAHERKKGEAHTLMEELAPLLGRWLRDSLLLMGIKGTEGGGPTPDPLVKSKTKGGRKTGTRNPPPPAQREGSGWDGEGKGSYHGSEYGAMEPNG